MAPTGLIASSPWRPQPYGCGRSSLSVTHPTVDIYTPWGYIEFACRHKATPRTAELQADVQKRLNRAIGQLNGVKAMIDDNRYCGDVLTQLAAVESAVRRVSEMLLAEHMRTCVVEEIRAGNDGVVDEAMELVRRFSK